MAVKSILPRDVYGICMTYKKLKDLKSFLIDLFSNPKMREAVPGSASISSDPSVFSIGQHMENSMVNPTAADIGKIWQDMNAMQVRFNKMSTGNPRNRSNKPEVTLPRRRGGLNRGRGGRQFGNSQHNDGSKHNDGFKQLKELGPSTPSTPDYQTPQYIPNHEKICLTREEAEYVYQSVKNGTQVKSVHISRKVDKSVDVSVNPYKEALTQEVDGQLHEEPSLGMKKCDLTWSILSTEIDYTTSKDDSPYAEMNSRKAVSE